MARGPFAVMHLYSSEHFVLCTARNRENFVASEANREYYYVHRQLYMGHNASGPEIFRKSCWMEDIKFALK